MKIADLAISWEFKRSCSGDSRAVEDELEHVRPLHEAPCDGAFFKRDRTHWIFAAKIRSSVIRLSPIHLTSGTLLLTKPEAAVVTASDDPPQS
jgi:hypothetical protein